MKQGYQLQNRLEQDRLMIQMTLNNNVDQVEKMMSTLVANDFSIFSFNLLNSKGFEDFCQLKTQYNNKDIVLGVNMMWEDVLLAQMVVSHADFISQWIYTMEGHKRSNRYGVPYIASCETKQDLLVALDLGAKLIQTEQKHLREILSLRSDLSFVSSWDESQIVLDNKAVYLVPLSNLADNQLKANLNQCIKLRSQVTSHSSKNSVNNQSVPQTQIDMNNIKPEDLSRIIQALKNQNK